MQKNDEINRFIDHLQSMCPIGYADHNILSVEWVSLWSFYSGDNGANLWENHLLK